MSFIDSPESVETPAHPRSHGAGPSRAAQSAIISKTGAKCAR